MEGFVATKLDEFESGKISRRKLIESLTLAATTVYAADNAQAQADTTLKARLINHISYTCPDFRQAADWYSKVFNLDQIGATNRDVALPFGKKGEQPYGVTAMDVPLSHLIIRSRDQNAAPSANAVAAARPRPAPQAVIDHIGYTVADFNRDKARAELTALGVKNIRDGGPRSLHFDDVFGYDVQISGLENNALTDG
jgi:catechol 2,3-dioxygenase-like lactoylglutathione lyase family enzyme